jgi:hypothetical protein
MNFKGNEVNALYKHNFWNSIKNKHLINNKKIDRSHLLHISIREDEFPVGKKQKSNIKDSVNIKSEGIRPFFAYSFFNSIDKKEKEFLKTSTAKRISFHTDVTSLFKSPTLLLIYLFNCMMRNNRKLISHKAKLKLSKLLNKKNRARRFQYRAKIQRKWEYYRFFSIPKTSSNKKESQAKFNFK